MRERMFQSLYTSGNLTEGGGSHVSVLFDKCYHICRKQSVIWETG